MVKNIVRNDELLKEVSTIATTADLETANDLLDTLKFNRSRCVGLAANMIGVNKRIIAFIDEKEKFVVMFNPKILKSEGEYDTYEGCLCRDVQLPTKRYQKIWLEYYNEKFQLRKKTFTGFVAQIIQHEIDHCNGIII